MHTKSWGIRDDDDVERGVGHSTMDLESSNEPVMMLERRSTRATSVDGGEMRVADTEKSGTG